jgi:hypothetical protein
MVGPHVDGTSHVLFTVNLAHLVNRFNPQASRYLEHFSGLEVGDYLDAIGVIGGSVRTFVQPHLTLEAVVFICSGKQIAEG